MIKVWAYTSWGATYPIDVEIEVQAVPTFNDSVQVNGNNYLVQGVMHDWDSGKIHVRLK